MQVEAQYYNSISNFLIQPDKEILGYVFSNEQYDATTKTREAWIAEIRILKDTLKPFALPDSSIIFEYTIPRVGGRIDCVVIIKGILFVIEFKTGDANDEALETYQNQLMQYCTDLKNFHFESYSAPMIPVLVVEHLPAKHFRLEKQNSDTTFYHLISVGSSQLGEVFQRSVKTIMDAPAMDPISWLHSPYCPTANIVEAARQLFNHHTVEDINRSDAKGENLIKTTRRIMNLIHQAKDRHEKYLCMITGVPGAGKTLVGLSVATEYKNEEHQNRSVYLSGNHPLVAVLQEALARDAYDRKKKQLEAELEEIEDKNERHEYKKAHKVSKVATKSEIKQFIQMIYLWRKEYLKGILVEGSHGNEKIVKDEEYYKGSGTPYLPYDHVAIFDEAQRTWNSHEHAKFVRSHTSLSTFPEWSEARFLISCMDRHQDWAVIVCLIGNGQDINHGEAGIGDWIKSIEHFPNWKIYAPNDLKDETDLSSVQTRISMEEDLHLAVNLRSIRAEKVSQFVDCLLMPDAKAAAEILKQIDHYPIVMTRDFAKAKQWVKSHAHGNDRYGVVASSKAQRLRPLAIDVSHSQTMNVEAWFLNGKDNVHSSYYMEDIATEFQIQGLEIDWACVAWDGDLVYQNGAWKHRQFKSNGWCNINNEQLRQYHINAYRVLLTRARRGMIILIPEGDLEDKTRNKEYYDGVYNYMKKVGIPEIQ